LPPVLEVGSKVWRRWWRGGIAKNAVEKKAKGGGVEVGRRKAARMVFRREPK